MRACLLAMFLAQLPFAVAEAPSCNPCVDGPEMFKHRNGSQAAPADAVSAEDISQFPDTSLSEALGNLPFCKLESDTSHQLEAPPRNAAALRDIARQHPRKNTFGPPASHRPGAVWDLGNEFWYREDSGDLVLYANTDDNFMYHWRFKTSGGKLRLVDHGLLECSGSE